MLHEDEEDQGDEASSRGCSSATNCRPADRLPSGMTRGYAHFPSVRHSDPEDKTGLVRGARTRRERRGESHEQGHAFHGRGLRRKRLGLRSQAPGEPCLDEAEALFP